MKTGSAINPLQLQVVKRVSVPSGYSRGRPTGRLRKLEGVC